jgi:UDP-N-acetylmuramate-alanine ligase
MPLTAMAGGDICEQAFQLLTNMYKQIDNSLDCEPLHQAPSFILLNGEIKDDIDILILESGSNSFNKYIQRIKDGGFLILNSDEKPIEGQITLKNATLISYGLNPKSCITVSSINQNGCDTVQICVQRPIPTISGNTVIEQEFGVSISYGINSNSILMAVTVALINDFQPKFFSDKIFTLP